MPDARTSSAVVIESAGALTRSPPSCIDITASSAAYQALTIPTFRLIVFANPESEGDIAKLRALDDPRIWIIGGSGPPGGAPAHYFSTIVEHLLPRRPSDRIDDAVKLVLQTMASGSPAAGGVTGDD